MSVTIPILHRKLAFDATADMRLPGVRPLDPTRWLTRDEVYAEQLGLKAMLLRDKRTQVLAEIDGSEDAQKECLDAVLRHLSNDHKVHAKPKSKHPLIALSEVAQEDFVILEKRGSEHVLTAAMVCFPASWRLADKIGRPLTAIHGPVSEYTPYIARRVQRLFDGVKVGHPMYRTNRLWYMEADLFQPHSTVEARSEPYEQARYFRRERQSIVRLPETQAVVFSIHTAILKRSVAGL